ncbi:mechanosensitive ion channel family protein [Lutimaribacter marinistellae]|uniref:Mechanosensitive ion channel family protein n=1 Tax=Lutimaribacter marinistellae TaxID=1820329 RepID=A0ABV7THM6_9RHOB
MISTRPHRRLIAPTFWLALVLSLMAMILGQPLAAQIPGVPTSAASKEDPDALADAIRAASEAGASVIIVGPDGTVTANGTQAGADPAAASDPMAGASSLMKAQSRIDLFTDKLSDRVEMLPNSVIEVSYILRATSPDGRIMTFVELLFGALVMFGVAWFAVREIYGKRIARNFVVSRVRENPQGYSGKMPFLVFRFVMGIGGTLFGMVVAYIGLAILFPARDNLAMQFTVTAIFTVFFLTRTISDLWRMILSPFLSQYRIPVISDRDARKLYFWASTLAFFDISVVIFSTWIADFGLNYNIYAILYGALSLAVAVLNVMLVLFNARAISNAIRGGLLPERVSWLLRVISVAWAPAIILLVLGSWADLAFRLVMDLPIGAPPIASTYTIFMSAVVAYGVLNYAVERYFERRAIRRGRQQVLTDGIGTEMATGHPIRSFQDLARRIAGIVAFTVGAYALLAIWYPDAALSEDTPLRTALDVLVIVLIGYVLFHLFRIWIDDKIAEEQSEVTEAELGDEGGEASQSRLATLLPLFRGAILAVVVISIVLIAMMELGINVSPLFAGAGVVGIAVGFGAQTLVRDIFSGAFFLIDDAFRKGEYIDIGDVKGTVEKISVRSFQLRHHLGALNTIPFGEIKVLTNYSRDWVIMKLPLRVTYDTDVEKVRKLIKKLGQQLLDDPVIGENFIQPLKSQGVIEMQDSAMIIRVKFMTKPGDQWLVRKKVYQEIRELFAREGIRFAHREVTVRLADEQAEDLTPKQREAVTGAVQAAIDEDMLDEMGPGGDDR